MATTTTAPRTAFAQRVQHARLSRAMAVHAIEERAGLGKAALRRLMIGQDQHAYTILRLSRAMDVCPRWLLDEGPIDPAQRVPWCEVLPAAASYADAAREIGPRLRAAREWRRLTGVEASARAGYEGNAFSQYEGGRHAPMLGTARRLARGLDIDLLWLLTGEGAAPWD